MGVPSRVGVNPGAIPGVITGSALAAQSCRGLLAGDLGVVLPPGALRAGSLVDLHADEGAGALALAFEIAAAQLREGQVVLFVDATGDFYPPAAAQAGLDPDRLVVLRPDREGADRGDWALACFDQGLRSRAVAAVVGRVARLDGPGSHRLRVAAEMGGGLGLLVRPSAALAQVSAAAVRLRVRGGAAGSRPRVEVARARGRGA